MAIDATEGTSSMSRALAGVQPCDERVLIIDDCRMRRELLVNELVAAGFVVSAAWDVESFSSCVGDKISVLLINFATRETKPILRLIFEAGLAPRVLVFGLSPEDESDIVTLAEAGVTGYHLRSESLSELIDFVSRVASGGAGCSPAISEILLQRLSRRAAEGAAKPVAARLTIREVEILKMLELGLSNQEIADRLSIATHTVKNHVHKVLSKIGARSRSQAAALFRNDSLREPL